MAHRIRTRLSERQVTALSVLVILLVIGALYIIVRRPLGGDHPPVTISSSDIRTSSLAVAPLYIHPLEIGERHLAVAFAVTPGEQAQGLSGTDSLPDGKGMLFIFPTDASLPFWMKDMRYGLDIIWIGSDKKVADITPNLQPSSYPNSFGPRVPVRYVLEVPAGFAKQNGIQVGDVVTF